MVERCPVCAILLRPRSRPRLPTCERASCVHEYRRRVWAVPGARACPVCGRRIDPLNPADTCGEPYCAEEFMSRLYRVRDAQERRAAKEAAAEMLVAGLRESGAVPAGALTAVLPAQDLPVGPPPPERRTLFAERLAGVLDDAAADPEGPVGDPVPAEATALVRAACTSCRGSCCKLGEDHAFLRPATLRRFLKAHPELTRAQALQKYLDRLPEESVAGSCLYHGIRGCALPREMRSDVCNRFHCDDLEKLTVDVSAAQNREHIVAVGFDRDRLVRVSILDQ